MPGVGRGLDAEKRITNGRGRERNRGVRVVILQRVNNEGLTSPWSEGPNLQKSRRRAF